MKLIRPYLFPPDLVFPLCVYTLLKLQTLLCFESPLFILLNHLLIQPLAEQITQRANSGSEQKKKNISISTARFNV